MSDNVSCSCFYTEHLRGSLKFAESIVAVSEGQLALSSVANVTPSFSVIRNRILSIQQTGFYSVR